MSADPGLAAESAALAPLRLYLPRTCFACASIALISLTIKRAWVQIIKLRQKRVMPIMALTHRGNAENDFFLAAPALWSSEQPREMRCTFLSRGVIGECISSSACAILRSV